MDTQTVDKTLQDCNFDLELTINKLQELHLASSETSPIIQPQQLDDHQTNHNVLGEDDLKWADLLVQEMTCATSIDDAKLRAARALAARDRDQAVTTDQLKQKNTRLTRENFVYKRLVVLQYERLIKEGEEKRREVDKLNGMLLKCREELKASEFNNYTLRMHLNQAAHIGPSSMINRLPDVY